VLSVIVVCLFLASMASAQSNQVYKWTGFYVGLNAGYGFGGDNNYSLSPVSTNWTAAVVGGGVAEPSFKPHGFVGGIQAGADWRFSNVFLIGLESDIQISDIGDKNRGIADGLYSVPGETKIQQDLKWFGTTRLRFGVLPMERLLAYATGGLAYGKVKSSASVSFIDGELYAGSKSKVETGYVIGGGLEFAFTKNIFMRREYLYYDLGRRGVPLLTISGGIPQESNGSFTTRGNIMRMGVNYKF